MCLVGLLRVHLHRRAVRGDPHRLGQAGLAGLHRAEQLLELLREPVADVAADADDGALGPVPAVDERRERVACRGADGFLRADDVTPERLVAVEQVLVDTADEVPRRVEVHVHLLDDDALLAVDLLGVEPRVADHVDEHVERDVAGGRGALDVVARVLLAGERVELAADAVDLGRDVARGRAALGALEEHVLGEMGDAADLGVSKREPAANMTKHETDWAWGIDAVRTRMPLLSVLRSKTAMGPIVDTRLHAGWTRTRGAERTPASVR